jgi:membrane protease YdiL (CAAX protease family)
MSSPTRPARVAWGLGDAVAAWGAGLVVGGIVSAFFLPDSSRPHRDLVPSLLIGLVVQTAVTTGMLARASNRKGRHSLGDDFGLHLARADLPWLFAGIGLQLASLVVLAPLAELYGRPESQDVVRLAERASSVELPLYAVAVVFLAPLAEELLFRGVLLRAFLRRTTAGRAALASAAIFGIVHPLLDPSVGSLIALPALVLLGLVSAHQAILTGSLSRSIYLHVGFNSLTAVILLSKHFG